MKPNCWFLFPFSWFYFKWTRDVKPRKHHPSGTAKLWSSVVSCLIPLKCVPKARQQQTFFFLFFSLIQKLQENRLNVKWMNKDTTGLTQGGKAQYESSPLTGQISLWCLLLFPFAFPFPHDIFFFFLVSQHICRVTFSTSDQPYLTISSLQYSKPIKEYIFLRYLKATRHLTYSKYTKLLGLMGLHFLIQHLPE